MTGVKSKKDDSSAAKSKSSGNGSSSKQSTKPLTAKKTTPPPLSSSKQPQPKRVSRPSELIERIKALESDNARLHRELKKVLAKVEKLHIDKSLYKLRIRATEEENKRIRNEYGLKPCFFEGSDSE